jgi:hypothetical protein
MHFIGYTKKPNANNSFYNRTNVGTTFNVGLNMYVSFVKEGKHN